MVMSDGMNIVFSDQLVMYMLSDVLWPAVVVSDCMNIVYSDQLVMYMLSDVL